VECHKPERNNCGGNHSILFPESRPRNAACPFPSPSFLTQGIIMIAHRRRAADLELQ
jgi:hypothetical protein